MLTFFHTKNLVPARFLCLLTLTANVYASAEPDEEEGGLMLSILTADVDIFASAEPRFETRVYLEGVFDNYAYGKNYPVTFNDRTLLYTRVQPEFGFRIAGSHKIRGVIICDFELDEGLFITANLRFHYHYDAERLQLRLGSFPRARTLDIPVWFFNRESQPFVHRGAAIEVNYRDITAGAWLDRSWLTDYVKKQFSFGAKLGYNPSGIFFARGDFMMMRYSATRLSVPDPIAHVVDNGGVSFEAGTAWGKTAFLDTLKVSAGAIIGLDRYRYQADNFWFTPARNISHTPAGGFINAFAAARILGMRSFLYIGESMRMWYGRDQWGRYWIYSPATYSYIETYGRLDLVARFTIKEKYRVEFTQAFHLLHNGGDDPSIEAIKGTAPVGYSQHFLLQAEFGGSPNKEKRR